MPVTVFAEDMGLFHKGSGGKGIAPGDVCLSPPPPPGVPAPLPYVNVLSASDLMAGSRTVKIQGNPTALEDSSYVMTSTGDEPGTAGGNIVTHRIKGKGYFALWCFTVQVEGKGVGRHGDMMDQNCASKPPGCVDPAAITAFLAQPWVNSKDPCPPGSYPGNRAPTEEQQDACRGGPCWSCKLPTSGWRARKAKAQKFKGFKAGERFTPDHQPPQVAAWYMGGCHNPEKFKEWADRKETVNKHCKSCSSDQGTTMRHTSVSEIRSWMK